MASMRLLDSLVTIRVEFFLNNKNCLRRLSLNIFLRSVLGVKKATFREAVAGGPSDRIGHVISTVADGQSSATVVAMHTLLH